MCPWRSRDSARCSWGCRCHCAFACRHRDIRRHLLFRLAPHTRNRRSYGTRSNAREHSTSGAWGIGKAGAVWVGCRHSCGSDLDTLSVRPAFRRNPDRSAHVHWSCAPAYAGRTGGGLPSGATSDPHRSGRRVALRIVSNRCTHLSLLLRHNKVEISFGSSHTWHAVRRGTAYSVSIYPRKSASV
jgi:hypothetical protein